MNYGFILHIHIYIYLFCHVNTYIRVYIFLHTLVPAVLVLKIKVHHLIAGILNVYVYKAINMYIESSEHNRYWMLPAWFQLPKLMVLLSCSICLFAISPL